MTLHPDILKDRLNESHVSIEELADRIADIFNCPITIEDSNHSLISYSRHSSNIDEVRVATIINRKVPDKVINGLWKNGIMPRLLDSDEPVVIPKMEETGLGNRVAISIRKNNEILGFIWAHVSDTTFTSEENRLFKEASLYVKKFLLQRRKRRRKSEEGYKDFFWQLLRGDFWDSDEILQKAKQYNMNLEGNKAIVVINFSDVVTEQMEKHAYYLSETQVKVSVITRLFDDDDFIMLVRLKDDESPKQTLKEFIQQFMMKLTGQLQLQHVHGSAGMTYPSSQKIVHSYHQATEVLRLKNKFPEKLADVFLYEDLGVYQFIERLNEFQKKNHYHNRQIENLRRYDEANHTFLLDTLETYLKNDNNVYQAAKEMFIHPNTMNYRLKRIREVGGINLSDPNQKVSLFLDLITDKLD
ncbi:transcriptional activator AdeR [Thalassobacillus devorans]|uniref:Transcriptional activator AdeR n=1 Tax=Thalassobacillus devorans TaxID=279813 RepID=A0ABQ1NKW2_9BACI|nr:helix-turn-helix domain-containing protein [Thalassobacillus devorans]NIK27466.1 DNA-binding PucR family transcriptional regulator [Thalassobacillus devorans]GGC77929.1 transcriptional activator AdeR [Thalassobacillus devorans]